MADDTTGKRKKSKSYFVGHKRKKRGTELLCPGMKGVLVSCNGRENLCTREACNLLTEYADKFYGPEAGSQEEEKNSGSEEDVEDALTKEVKGMKETKQKKRFEAVISGAKNVIFIKTNLPDSKDPTDLAHRILTDILTTKCRKTRHCQRFLPVGGSCRANIEDIQKLGQEMFQSSIFAEDVKPSKFSVMYRSRHNGDINRDKVIAALAGDVMAAGRGHTVDLGNPDFAICVEIIKNVCCMAVVKDFFKLRKYNICELNEQINKSKQHQNILYNQSNSVAIQEENRDSAKVETELGKENKDGVTDKDHQEKKLEIPKDNDSKISQEDNTTVTDNSSDKSSCIEESKNDVDKKK